jgi:hypothetical protein
MTDRILKVAIGGLVSSLLFAACDGLPWRSDKAAPPSDTSSSNLLVDSGTADGVGWELRAKKGDQVCAELIQTKPRRTVSRVCPQSNEDPNTGQPLKYALGTLTSTKRHAFVVIVSGITEMQVSRITVDFASGQPFVRDTKDATGFASSHRYFAIPLETIPEGGIKAISASDESGNTLARFEATSSGFSPVPAGTSPGLTSVSPSPTGGTPTAAGVPGESAAFAGSPPWLEMPVSQSQAPRVLMVAWEKAKNRSDCSPLAPESLGEGEGGKPRRANFSGGWAVAYDKPGLPGRLRSGEPCKDCGRGVFGIAGTATEIKGPDELDASNALPLERRWSDGSRADYGLEGGTGPNYLANLFVQGEGCVYNVWSFLGQAHLEYLLDHLRFVQAGRT